MSSSKRSKKRIISKLVGESRKEQKVLSAGMGLATTMQALMSDGWLYKAQIKYAVGLTMDVPGVVVIMEREKRG